MLAVGNGHLECVLAGDWLAPPLSNLRVLALPDVVQLRKYVHYLFLFLLLRQRPPSLAALDLRQCIDFSLHTVDLKGAGHVLLDFWLVDLAKDVEVGAIVLLVRVKPIEGQGAVRVQRQWVLKLLKSQVVVYLKHVLVSTRLILFHFLPLL